jgi:hypothetical protein
MLKDILNIPKAGGSAAVTLLVKIKKIELTLQFYSTNLPVIRKNLSIKKPDR